MPAHRGMLGETRARLVGAYVLVAVASAGKRGATTPRGRRASDRRASTTRRVRWRSASARSSWPSFFAAGVATMVFFAFVDPLQLRDITFPARRDQPRARLHASAFFMFWLATAASSLFTWILLRPCSRFNRPLPER